jgi:hypothetical protein
MAQGISAQAPVFAHPVQSVNVCAGTTTTVFTAEYTPYPATVIWQVSTDSGSTWQDVSPSPIYTSVGNRLLQITKPPISMTRYQYRAIATNSSGTATSGPGVLYVNTGIPNTPVFVNPPTDVAWGNTQEYHITGGLEGDTIAWVVDNHSVGNNYANFNDTAKLLNILNNSGTSTINVYAYNGCPAASSQATYQLTVHPLSSTLPSTGGGTTCINMASDQWGYRNFFSDASYAPVCSFTSIGQHALTGPVQSCVTVDPSVQSYNGMPYVQRHYNIEPQNNASTASTILTLYYTQADFDAYNAVRGANPALPTGPSDAAGIANIRIAQFHGTGTTPGTYTGTTEVINPNDNNGDNHIGWNSGNFFDGGNRWEVTFDVTGFSGFFVSTGSLIPLPLTLTDFTGQTTDKGALLQWATGQEQNTAYFNIQSSTAGGSFTDVARVTAAGNSHLPLHYQYLDPTFSGTPTSYRLKMVDLDGAATYSRIVILGKADTYAYSLQVSPNPVLASATLTVTSPAPGKGTLVVTDISGRQIYQQQVVLAKGVNTFPAASVPPGSYQLTLVTDKQRCTTKFVRY